MIFIARAWRGGGGEKSKNFERDHIIVTEWGREGESGTLAEYKGGLWKTTVDEEDHQNTSRVGQVNFTKTRRQIITGP